MEKLLFGCWMKPLMKPGWGQLRNRERPQQLPPFFNHDDVDDDDNDDDDHHHHIFKIIFGISPFSTLKQGRLGTWVCCAVVLSCEHYGSIARFKYHKVVLITISDIAAYIHFHSRLGTALFVSLLFMWLAAEKLL